MNPGELWAAIERDDKVEYSEDGHHWYDYVHTASSPSFNWERCYVYRIKLKPKYVEYHGYREAVSNLLHGDVVRVENSGVTEIAGERVKVVHQSGRRREDGEYGLINVSGGYAVFNIGRSENLIVKKLLGDV